MRILMILLLLTALCGALEDNSKKKSDPGPHPLKILKVTVEPRDLSMSSNRGQVAVWLQNVYDVGVDKVRIEVQLYDKNGKLRDKLVKQTDLIDPGKKTVYEFNYDLTGFSDKPRPRIWVFYNGGLDRLTQFEAEIPAL